MVCLPRPMWMGIAAMSVLLPSRQAIPGRVKGRIWGNLAGGAGFCLLYCLLPGSLLPYLGIFGGIGVGLSATYGWQAVFNSLGAMSIMRWEPWACPTAWCSSAGWQQRPVATYAWARGPAGRPRLAGAAARRQLNAGAETPPTVG
ncbi:MAG: FUSC family protein [Evtepia gabavorous]